MRAVTGAPHPRLRRLAYRVRHGVIAGAPTVVAGERFANLVRSGVRPAREQILGGEEDARRAEPALERVLLGERLLEIEDLPRAHGGRSGCSGRAAPPAGPAGRPPAPPRPRRSGR